MASSKVGVAGVRVGITLNQAMFLAGDVLQCVIRLEAHDEEAASGSSGDSHFSKDANVPQFNPHTVHAVVMQVCGVLSLTRRGDDGSPDPLLAELLSSPQQNMYRHMAQQWLVTGPPLENSATHTQCRDGSVMSCSASDAQGSFEDSVPYAASSKAGVKGHAEDPRSRRVWSSNSGWRFFRNFERLPSKPPFPPPEESSWLHEDPAACAVYGQQSKLLFLSEPCVVARNVCLKRVDEGKSAKMKVSCGASLLLKDDAPSAVFGFHCNLPPFLPPSHRISGGGGYQYFLTVHVFRTFQTSTFEEGATSSSGEVFGHSVGRVPLWVGGCAEAESPNLLTAGPPVLPASQPPLFAGAASCVKDWGASLLGRVSSRALANSVMIPQPQPFHFQTRVVRPDERREMSPRRWRLEGPLRLLRPNSPGREECQTPLPLESVRRLWALGNCVLAFDEALVDALLAASAVRRRDPSLVCSTDSSGSRRKSIEGTSLGRPGEEAARSDWTTNEKAAKGLLETPKAESLLKTDDAPEEDTWKHYSLLRGIAEGEWGASSTPRSRSFRISQDGQLLCMLYIQPVHMISGCLAICAGATFAVWFDFSESSLSTLEVTVAVVCTEQPVQPSPLQRALLQGPSEVKQFLERLGYAAEKEKELILEGVPRGPSVSRLVWVESDCTANKITSAVCAHAPSTALPSCQTDLMRLSYSLVVRFTCPKKQQSHVPHLHAETTAPPPTTHSCRIKASDVMASIWEIPIVVLPAGALASQLEEEPQETSIRNGDADSQDLTDADLALVESTASICPDSSLSERDEFRRLDAACDAALFSGAASRARRELVL